MRPSVNSVRHKLSGLPLALKVSIAYMFCTVVQKGLSFITMPIFTRILTTDEYGQYTVYNSWMYIFSVFITLNLGYGSFSTAMIKFETRRDQYIASLEGIFLLLSGIFFLVYIPFRDFWNSVLKMPTMLVCLMVLEIVSVSSLQLWSGKKRFEFKYKSVILITLLNAILAPIFALFLVWNSADKGYARILGYAVINIIIGGCFFAHNAIKGKRLFSSEFWKYALSFNTPLLIYFLSQSIFNHSDRMMIQHFCGSGKAAMYGVAYNLALLIILVLNAINSAYEPWVFEKLKAGKQCDNREVSVAIAAILTVLLLCVIWFAPEIIAIMAGSQYAEAVWVVPPVAISQLLLFYSQLFIYIEFYYEKKTYLVYASVGAAVVNIILNVIFIPLFGFVVAGYTTLLSYLLFSGANYIAMKMTLKEQQISDHGYDLKKLAYVLLILILLSGIGMLFYDSFVARFVILVGIMMLLRKQIYKWSVDMIILINKGN